MSDATHNAASPAVRFEKVTKRYGDVAAVDAVSFDIAPATLVTLLGPSGCGKTTTLRLVAGLEQASEGRIFIDGADVTRLSAADASVTSWPPIRMRPLDGSSSPAISRRVVVLPQPDGPSNVTSVPAAMTNEMSFTAATSP